MKGIIFAARRAAGSANGATEASVFVDIWGKGGRVPGHCNAALSAALK
jgi:hypothetical protein